MDDIKQSMAKGAKALEAEDTESAKKHEACGEAVGDIAKHYPLTFVVANLGKRYDKKKDEYCMLNPEDNGLQWLVIDKSWQDARTAEYMIDGATAEEAQGYVGRSLYHSVVAMIDEMATAFSGACADADIATGEHHEIEILADALANAVAKARDNDMPASVIQRWLMPAVVISMEKKDIARILEKAVDRLKEGLDKQKDDKEDK